MISTLAVPPGLDTPTVSPKATSDACVSMCTTSILVTRQQPEFVLLILETIQSDSAPHVFQNNEIYTQLRLVKSNFVMNDSLNQNICLDVDKVHLRAVSLTDLQHEGKRPPCPSSPPWLSLFHSKFLLLKHKPIYHPGVA